VNSIRRLTWNDIQNTRETNEQELLIILEKVCGVMEPPDVLRFLDMVFAAFDFAAQRDFLDRMDGLDSSDPAVALAIAKSRDTWTRARRAGIWWALAMVVSFVGQLESGHPIDPSLASFPDGLAA
jgi:hypothetical protein